MGELSGRPNILVAFGSGSRLLNPLIDEYSTTGTVIRVFNRAKPTAKENCLDISSSGDVYEAIRETVGVVKDPRIGFVGAASRNHSKLFSTTSMNDISEILNVNIVEYVRLVHFLLPFMIRHQYGRMVFLSSFRSVELSRGLSLYAASKSFGETFFRCLGREYAKFNICTASIRMGYFDGKMFDQYSETQQRDELKRVAIGRLGTAEELREAINFCFSSPLTNGGIMDFDGGILHD